MNGAILSHSNPTKPTRNRTEICDGILLQAGLALSFCRIMTSCLQSTEAVQDSKTRLTLACVFSHWGSPTVVGQQQKIVLFGKPEFESWLYTSHVTQSKSHTLHEPHNCMSSVYVLSVNNQSSVFSRPHLQAKDEHYGARKEVEGHTRF